MGNAIVYVMVQRTYKKIYMSRFVLEIFLRILFFGRKKAFYKKYSGEILFFRQEKEIYKKFRREILFFRQEKAFYKKFR